MRLTDLLSELKSTRQVIKPAKPPQHTHVERAYSRLQSAFESERTTSAVEHDSLRRMILSSTQSSLNRLTFREMRLTASILFEGHDRIADHPALLDRYLGMASQANSRLIWRRLISSYLSHFSPHDLAVRKLGRALAEAVVKHNGLSEWRERERKYRIFDADRVVEILLASAMRSPDARATLASAGLSGQFWQSSLSQQVFLSFLDATRQSLERAPTIDNVKMVFTWAGANGRELDFTALRSNIADSLLLPWMNRSPPAEIQSEIQASLLTFLGDPRTDIAHWARVDGGARSVMIRWLAQATLEQFLKVVDRVAAAHQWEYRRAFWKAYIDKGWVSDAWVAFGTTGASVAHRIARETADEHMRRFAQLNGSAPDQAVLLLSIGDLLIADWSHNGKLRIWLRGNTTSPKTREAAYSATALRSGSDFDIAHLPPDGWQARAEAYIQRHTKLRLTEREYMPPRRR